MEGKVIMSLDDYNHLVGENKALEITLIHKREEIEFLKNKWWDEVKKNIKANTLTHLFVTDETISEENVKHYTLSSLYLEYDLETILKAVKEIYDEWNNKQR